MVQKRRAKAKLKVVDKKLSIDWMKVLQMIALLCVLQWMWPNIVHEPLHFAALKLQGSDGYMSLDFSFPAHPTTTRTQDLSGLTGALIFYLLPSLVSLLILATIWLTRNKGNEWTHFVLPAYLCFDLIINIRNYTNPISDFRMLLLMPNWVPLALILITMIGMAAIITRTKCTVQEYCLMEVFK